MSVYNLAFRAGVPLGALVLGKLIPIFVVSTAVAGFGAVSGWRRRLLPDRNDENPNFSTACEIASVICWGGSDCGKSACCWLGVDS